MSKLIINNRYLEVMAIALNPKTRLFVGEGTIRSSKTVDFKNAFFECVQDSCEELHLLTANDLDAINDNILDGEDGLLTLYPEYLKIQKDEIGGYYLSCKCDLPNRPKEKKILLCGYANASKWKKILGKTLGVLFVDEANTANKQFIDECFARQVSADYPKMFWTLNGDVPTHWIYTDYINRCKIIGECPASIRADMEKVPNEIGWYYMHFNMSHNPIMTKEKIERASSIYPVGSYYYTIKILGERGSPGDLIYLEYLSEKLFRKFEPKEWHSYGIGVDIGASKAKNSFVLVAFDKQVTKAMIVDKMTFQQCGYNVKTEMLEAFVKRHLDKPIQYIAVDSAEQNYIRDLKGLFKSKGLPEVIASYKATIKERIDMGIILLSLLRLLFNTTAEGQNAYSAFQIAKWKDDKKGQEREDNNEWHIDVLDSIEYALTRHMKQLMLANKEVN